MGRNSSAEGAAAVHAREANGAPASRSSGVEGAQGSTKLRVGGGSGNDAAAKAAVGISPENGAAAAAATPSNGAASLSNGAATAASPNGAALPAPTNGAAHARNGAASSRNGAAAGHKLGLSAFFSAVAKGVVSPRKAQVPCNEGGTKANVAVPAVNIPSVPVETVSGHVMCLKAVVVGPTEHEQTVLPFFAPRSEPSQSPPAEPSSGAPLEASAAQERSEGESAASQGADASNAILCPEEGALHAKAHYVHSLRLQDSASDGDTGKEYCRGMSVWRVKGK